MQIYHFDAYGNLLNFADGTTPLTNYLYSGESFDFNIGQQYLRARWYDATTGRFNRLAPFFGNSSDPQSFHKYAYVHGDPINGVDPTGMFLGVVIGLGIEYAMPGPDDLIQAGLEALVQAYPANLEWDLEWALDFSLPDSWGSRLDDSWVYSALGAGLHDTYDVWTPFGTVNPLDVFATAASIRGPNGGVSSVFFRGGHIAQHATSRIVEYTKDSIKLTARVSYFVQPKIVNRSTGSHFPLVNFPERLKAAKVKIVPSTPSKSWDRLSPQEINTLKSDDILKATSKLKRDNGGRLPSGFEEVFDQNGWPNGQLWVKGELHSWHHDFRKG